MLSSGQLVDCARVERAHKRKEINNNTNYNRTNIITIITTYNNNNICGFQLIIATFGRKKIQTSKEDTQFLPTVLHVLKTFSNKVHILNWITVDYFSCPMISHCRQRNAGKLAVAAFS